MKTLFFFCLLYHVDLILERSLKGQKKNNKRIAELGSYNGIIIDLLNNRAMNMENEH